MSSKRTTALAVALATLVLAMTSASAEARIRCHDLEDPHKDYTQRGVQLYVGLGGQDYSIEDNDYKFLDEFDADGMFFFGVSLGLDRGVSLYFEGNASEHQTPSGDMTFGIGLIGIKYAPNSGPRHLWQPYGKFGLGGVYLWQDESCYELRRHHDEGNGYTGPAIGIAAGLDRFIGRRTAIFAEVGLTTGELETRVIKGKKHDLTDEIAITSGRVQFGLRFRL